MKLIAKLLSATLTTGQAQDLSFELTLENDSPRKVLVCAKNIPWTNGLGYHGFGASWKATTADVMPRGVYRPMNPAWGPPAPPYLVEYFAQQAVALAPGQTRPVPVSACVVPRLGGLTSSSLLALSPLPGPDPTALSLIVFETRCAELLPALSKKPAEALYGRPVVVVPRGEQVVTFSYVEQPGFGFKPETPLQLTAPPLTLSVN